MNDSFQLGQIGRQSVREVWDGAELAQLRDALDEGDYRYGCQDCESDIVIGERRQTHAESFDRFPQPSTPHAWPRRVEFALSNACNLQCVQCNGDLSSSIRSHREHRPPLRSPYGDAFFSELREVLPHIEVAVFIGGEPFLSRECRRVWDLLIEMDLHPEVHVTTNGTVWDERVEHYLHSLCMTVAVSIDGATAATNDAIRLGSKFEDVTANRDRFLAATRSYGSAFCLNHCLMRDNWHELGDFLLDAERLDVGVHVIPVYYPSTKSLLTLPAEELDAVLRQLQDQGERVRPRLTRNAAAWDAAVGLVRSRLAAGENATPVSVGRGPLDPPSARVIDEARAELTRWAGREPLTICSRYGVVEEVELPPWAAPLALEPFEGQAIEALEAHIAQNFGAPRELRAEPGGLGFSWYSYVLEFEGGPARCRTAVVPGWGVLTGIRPGAEIGVR